MRLKTSDMELLEKWKSLDKELREKLVPFKSENGFNTYEQIEYMGMEPSGDYGHEWDTPEEIESSRIKNAERIRLLKESGYYGKPYILSMSLKHDPLFDNRPQPARKSYRFDIIDFSKPTDCQHG